MDEEEIWKDVPGYEQYLMVSNTGKLFNKRQNKEYSIQFDKKGYPKISFYINGKFFRFTVHRLVALTFIDNPLKKPQVNHIDGVKNNNHVSNLEWVTSQENIQHAYDNGLRKSGVNNALSKLSHDDVEYIRQNPLKLSHKKLAGLFGVSGATIYNVIHRLKYK